MSFYVYLPSNSSSSYFPDNTISKFRTKLAKRISLSESYEVALTEISYFNSYNIIRGDVDRTITIQYKDSGESKSVQKKDIILPDIVFKSVDEIVKCINAEIKRLTDNISIWVEQNIKKVKLDLQPSTAIEFSWKLVKILGFQKRGYFKPGEKVGNENPDMKIGSYFYIYTDIIQPQLVGDSESPLLRIVDNSKESLNFKTVAFRPYYKPVIRNDFDVIECLISNEYGESINFRDGPCTLTLHFKPVGMISHIP